MSEKEKASIKAVVEAVKALGDEIPNETKQYLLGYSECLAETANRRQPQPVDDSQESA